MALQQLQHLHFLRELDEELPIPRQMMDSPRIAVREAAHRLDALPMGDRHELGLGRAILAEGLDGQRLPDQRFDADLVVVDLVLVGALARCAALVMPISTFLIAAALRFLSSGRGF